MIGSRNKHFIMSRTVGLVGVGKMGYAMAGACVYRALRVMLSLRISATREMHHHQPFLTLDASVRR